VKLYVFHVAPNPTRVRRYLAEKRAGGAEIPVEEVMVSIPDGESRAPEHLARNPRGGLPVLEMDDGSFLTESTAIVEYLEERWPEPPMIGTDAESRARVRELDRIADLGVLISVARIVHATKSPTGAAPNPAVAAAARAALPSNLKVLDNRLSDGRPFLAGDRPTIADGTLAAALQFGRFREITVTDGYPHIRRWDEAYRARPEVQGVLLV